MTESYLRWTRHIPLLLAMGLSVACSGAQQENEPGIALAELLSRSEQALGIGSSRRLEYSGSGWDACLGQAWHISQGWARWEVTDFTRVIDFSRTESRQSALRQAGMDQARLGGCGAQPGSKPALQQSSITPDSDWVQQLPMWLTPQGALELAGRSDGDAQPTEDGWLLEFSVLHEEVEYPVEIRLDRAYRPVSVSSVADNTVFGDMQVQALFSEYRNFDGFWFPSRLVRRQGGHSTLELNISSASGASTLSTSSPPGTEEGSGPGPAEANSGAFSEIGDGIFLLGGAYQSVVVEFARYVMVIGGLQNDRRSREIIRLVGEAIPGKPVRYVVNTHAHFDHAAGLREFIAEGSTILTHQSNRAFFEQALSRARTLNPDTGEPLVGPIKVQGVGERFVVSDTSGQVVELYHLTGSFHADDMLIAYLPGIATVVEADLLQPWINPVFGGDGDEPHPYLVYFYRQLNRLGLDYQQFIPIHKPGQSQLMSRAELEAAVQ